MKTVLTIAGSDCSGGAGIQADLKTMTMHGVYGMSAITALTAQNTVSVLDIMEVPADFLKKQLDAIFTDIRPDAIKIGMTGSNELIRVIASELDFYKAENVVLDPVMISSSGTRLLPEDAIEELMNTLLKRVDLVTPNIPELELLTQSVIKTPADMIKAAETISHTYHCAVLCKGGHSIHDANDLLYQNNTYEWFYGERINNSNTHGTGCTLSSAIASNLALSYSLSESVAKAKTYIEGALGAMLDLGAGSGPMNHAFAITNLKTLI